ncbi:hypothetical protein LOTGIDRAFT_159678 [Lottia gigantea]|uniref:Uncharacterized protein n=1 Tax=Lottia gigantea TaxID=225164 RepID=V4C5P5_LOTGI|nr:hypothetical protein LOTGIDRAFT_159678 [Lottia gigantea]ESO96924.1 hypothetical protein LOTGIDRAFT_159678 [Lottia gigantea]
MYTTSTSYYVVSMPRHQGRFRRHGRHHGGGHRHFGGHHDMASPGRCHRSTYGGFGGRFGGGFGGFQGFHDFNQNESNNNHYDNVVEYGYGDPMENWLSNLGFNRREQRPNTPDKVNKTNFNLN